MQTKEDKLRKLQLMVNEFGNGLKELGLSNCKETVFMEMKLAELCFWIERSINFGQEGKKKKK